MPLRNSGEPLLGWGVGGKKGEQGQDSNGSLGYPWVMTRFSQQRSMLATVLGIQRPLLAPTLSVKLLIRFQASVLIEHLLYARPPEYRAGEQNTHTPCPSGVSLLAGEREMRRP